MLFYVAMVWNEQNAASAQTAALLLQRFEERSPDWSVALAAPGLVVSCRIAKGCARIREIYQLQGNAGVVLGKLFHRRHEAGETPNRIVLDEDASGEIIASAGRYLIEHYWGQYVAFLRDRHARVSWVLRDPTGGLDCYVTHFNGIDIYFLRLEDCERLGLPPMSLSRRGLIARTVFHVSCTRVTGLNEVTSLLAGECAELRGGCRSVRSYWSPLEIARKDVIEDPLEAERLTHQTVKAVVHAWASCFETILHRLSGGLDSAIVLACLKDAPNRPNVVCENLYGQTGARWDEREYARLAARQACCELIETPIRAIGRYNVHQRLPPAPEPYYLEPMEGDIKRMGEMMSGTYVPAIFCGLGGDELFFRHGDLPTVVDYLHRHGLQARATSIACMDSLVDRASLWRIARCVFREGLPSKGWNLRKRYMRLLRRNLRAVDELVPQDLREEAVRDDSLWPPLYIDDITGVPPGKAHHCYLISLAAEAPVYQPPPDQPALPVEVCPLYSQPFIEVSLRTPLYVLRDGGQDRAIARRAFRNEIPSQILARRSKGCGNEIVQRALSSNLPVIRERLLNGRLVQLGYLNRTKLAEALALDVPTPMQNSPINLQRHFMNELWLAQLPSNTLARSM